MSSKDRREYGALSLAFGLAFIVSIVQTSPRIEPDPRISLYVVLFTAWLVLSAMTKIGMMFNQSVIGLSTMSTFVAVAIIPITLLAPPSGPIIIGSTSTTLQIIVFLFWWMAADFFDAIRNK